ncbi:nuclear transport factor 2 family protein [Acetobacter pasteurianus]|uniref:Aromatic-ring-hydroxylating dioxygenase beta subunit n=1 Tax=Acetobacter pasteurianus NBRC 3188 TaxID=1226663 RepID=A0A401WVP4_ACEPA|nr:aromatic-ring-hydroxylating dioxygenase subunit beta [Acetobacter pasteurianus]GCD53419.1 hypothetical protein NBRC3188_2116 [Acetobacter pasteurianus NBRC 3188]
MSISLNDAVELVTLEADLLDDGQFTEWLKLYTQSGFYIIPIDPDADDYADTLNYAYDDAEMRQKRVERLIGGALFQQLLQHRQSGCFHATGFWNLMISDVCSVAPSC